MAKYKNRDYQCTRCGGVTSVGTNHDQSGCGTCKVCGNRGLSCITDEGIAHSHAMALKEDFIRDNAPKSIVDTRDTKKVFSKIMFLRDYGKEMKVVLKLTYNDNCRNGYNNYHHSIEILNPIKRNDFEELNHDIGKYFPEFSYLDKWHGFDTRGNTHMMPNISYWIDEGNIKNANSTALTSGLNREELLSLDDGNPITSHQISLIKEFKSIIEDLGFTY